MTQSGQGEEPSARQAHEGIVLPSDGGAPVPPGPAGGPAGPQDAQSWDQQWASGPQHGPSQGGSWPAPPAHQGPARGPGPLPPENPLPPAGPGAAHEARPPYGQQQEQPYGQQAYGQPQSYEPQSYGQQAYGRHAHGHQPYGQSAGAAAPLPPDEGATQYIPPVGAPVDEGVTQYLPPVGVPVDEGATQYIPPVNPGALPPERPAGTAGFPGHAPQRPAPAAPPAHHPDAEATQYIAPVPAGPAAAPHGGAPGADDGRQPPPEFDSLFRSAPPADSPASATQQLPRIDEPDPVRPGGPAGYGPQGPGGGRRGGGHGGRTGSRLPVLVAVGVGIAVVGVGAGAMMAGGEGGDKGAGQNVSATAPAAAAPSAPVPSASASPSADPARQQAVELDKLLAHSGNSRTTVINAVADVRSCDNLPQAAKDLREAAKQRTGLVTSLSRLSVDKLPRHTELTTALTKAWQASASADNHYAAWADRTAGKKGCKKGKAATQPSEANRASGTATKEKAKAAKLWNAIAERYGLTERQPTQL
ncbi:hypothetical protein ABZ023_11170 [Streptomyces sp. NPDC006367]|uniref:hypothetical protein n=1 Tax=unclassified Streptomyces TaxID=2593676 RepID=UPI0033AE2B43